MVFSFFLRGARHFEARERLGWILRERDVIGRLRRHANPSCFMALWMSLGMRLASCALTASSSPAGAREGAGCCMKSALSSLKRPMRSA